MTKRVLPAALLAALLSLASYLAFGDVNLNVVDESYLWYGVRRIAQAGEVPLRDFQAYDPGRYYWCVAWGWIFGTGILGLRIAGAIFQALGLFCGLLAARRAVRSQWLLIPIALVLIAWMFPRHKYFESAIAMMAVYAGVRLLESPTRRGHFLIGLFVGVVGVFGRNLAAYAFVGVLALIVFLALRVEREGWFKRLVAYGLGVLAGYSPLLLMLAFVPGFAAGFVESMVIQAKLGSNLSYPWPWQLGYAGLSWDEVVSQIGLVVSYLVPVIVLPVGIVVALRTRAEDVPARALLIAGTFLGVFYIYHASVRSDAAHLAQCVHPSLLALFGLPAALGWTRHRALATGLWAVFGLLTFFTVLDANHMLKHFRRGGGGPGLVSHDVAGETLRMFPFQASLYTRLEETIEQHVDDEVMFIAPSRPGLYPLLGKRSPVWWLYFVLPEADEGIQDALIDDLAATNWALIVDVPVAMRQDLLLRNSNPKLWDYLLAEFRRVPTRRLPPEYVLFQRR